MQAHAISGPWAAGERVLVCVSEDPASAALVRYARRLADRLHAPWTALYVETRAHQRLDEARARPHRRQRCASPSGSAARPSPFPGGGIADDVVDYAAGQQLHPHRHRQVRALALVRDAARLGGARSDAPAPATSASTSSPATSASRGAPRAVRDRSRRAPSRSTRGPMSAASAIVAAALGVGLVLQQFLQRRSNIALVFLTAVLVSGGRASGCGRRSSPASSACSPTISSSCRRSTPSPSPTPRTSSRCSSS